MPDAPPPAVRAARRLLDALVHLGVRHVVVAPGSRSAPLALAAAELADAGELTLHVRLDERDAAFLALGLARGSALALGADGGSGAGIDARALAATEAAPVPAPVAVVTTSGTAVANLHPAVLEAHHAGVPLLLLTADRPHELRGTGANQTTDQVGLFAGATRLTVDVPAPDGRPGELDDLDHLAARAVDAARGARSGHPGPVHLDLAYRDPLVPGPGSSAARDARAEAVGPTVHAAVPARPPVVVPGPAVTHLDLPGALAVDVVETVVVAGDGSGRIARELAEARGWPVLAEPSSGACGGPAWVAAHPLVLGVLGERVRRVVVLGRPTLSRPVQQLLAGALASSPPVPVAASDAPAPSGAPVSGDAPTRPRPRVDVVVIAPGGAPWPDAARNASWVLPAIPAEWFAPSTADDAGRTAGVAARADWTATWRAASAAAHAVVRESLDDGPGARSLDGRGVAAEVAAASRPDDVLVVGSSSPVRDLDLVAAWDEPPTIVANRGLAGIDGLVATASGVALAVVAATVASAGPERRVRAYFGDLTFLHDVGGLLRLVGDPSPELQIVVANDGGGSIFSTLEPGDAHRVAPTTFERVFATPHDVDLASLCAAYGVRHERVATRADLAAVLAEPSRGTVVVEAVVDRARRRDDGLRLAAEVARAVAEAANA